VKITVRNLPRKTLLAPGRIKKLALEVLSSEGIKKSGEIALYFVNDRNIRLLNAKYLGTNSPTDVIAFDISGPGGYLCADVVICVDRARANAGIFNTSLRHELYLYAIHGILHLLGYRDRSARERKAMAIKSNRLLKSFLVK